MYPAPAVQRHRQVPLQQVDVLQGDAGQLGELLLCQEIGDAEPSGLLSR